MADSDDEYDRKRRDKFRGERSTGDTFRAERRDDRRPMGGGGGAGGRDDWNERNPFRGGAGLSGGGLGGGGGRPPRPDYREYRGPRERYGSPGREMPPAKRMRPDWGDDIRGGGNPRFGNYDPYLMHAWNEHYAHSLHSAYAHAAHPHGPREPLMNTHPDTQTQPAMMTLKQFLETQDDGISDSEVLRKYTEYKTEFKRQQLNEFFVAHKDEEWFKQKYHPEESVKRKSEQRGFLKKRIEVFTELLQNGTVGGVKVDSVHSDALIKLLDTVVIKLEGGTDEDLKVLDEKPKEPTTVFAERKIDVDKKPEPKDDDVIITSVEKKLSDDEDLPLVVSPRPHQRVLSDEENWDDDEDVKPRVPSPKQSKKKKKSLKRKRGSSDSSASSASESDSESSEEDNDDDEKVKQKYDLAAEDTESSKDIKVENESKEVVEQQQQPKEDSLESIGDFDDDSRKNESDIKSEDNTVDGVEASDNKVDTPKSAEAMEEDDDEKTPESPAEAKLAEDNEKSNDVQNNDNETNGNGSGDANDADDEGKVKECAESANDNQPETIDLDKVKDPPQPRALHRTSSIFLRNLAPAITKAEIEAICQRFSGYLRVAIADPLVERRWFRRGWITFQRDVNIKEICWNLNNQRVRDCEMGAIVNRDLSRRVRPANGITAHKPIVRADIKFCAKIAMNLDARFNLWKEESEPGPDSGDNTVKPDTGDAESKSDGAENEQKESNDNESSEQNNSKKPADDNTAADCYGFKTRNPVLQNITDFLIEEASAEEDELLGISGDNKDGDGETLDRDEQLISVLDRLVLYLRIVHSVDYYNHCEYPYEDEMPNRCGIIHARGPPPAKVTANDVQDYIKQFENKLHQFLTKVEPLPGDEVKSLGAKDCDAEVEKFIQANTQELAKDKWLCPLSGKKFKGPEFIRKHIFNKHMEKIEEVKKEVEFFNNYLRDPKRPQLPEHPGSNKRTNSESSNTGGGGGGYRPPMYPPAFAAPPYGFPPSMMMPGRGGAGRGFNGPRRPGGNDYRPRSHYRDLDAPQEHY